MAIDGNDLTVSLSVLAEPEVAANINSDASGVDVSLTSTNINVVPAYVDAHIQNMNNPHQTTYVQVGAAPARLSVLEQAVDTGTSFRNNNSVYVNSGNNGYRMTLQQIKEMNTKIVTAIDLGSADMTKLTVGDFIYIND